MMVINMNTESNPDYTKPELLARFLRSFDNVVQGKYLAHAMGEQLRSARVNTEQQMEAMRQTASHEEPTITYVPREKEPRRRLGWFSRLRYNRDNIRLRKYNREWIKNNIR